MEPRQPAVSLGAVGINRGELPSSDTVIHTLAPTHVPKHVSSDHGTVTPDGSPELKHGRAGAASAVQQARTLLRGRAFGGMRRAASASLQ